MVKRIRKTNIIREVVDGILPICVVRRVKKQNKGGAMNEDENVFADLLVA